MAGKPCDATGHDGPHDAAAADGSHGPAARDASTSPETAMGDVHDHAAPYAAGVTSTMCDEC